MDEKYLKIGGGAYYDLNCIDSKTKFVLAHLLVKHRTKKEVIEFLRQVKDSCYDQILAVCNFENYKRAFNKLFYRTCKLKFGVPIACRKYGLDHNNNAIERYNEEIKERCKVLRGFKNPEYANSFLEMRRIVHNLLNPHMSLEGSTPAQMAGIHLSLGRNKLLSLIRYVYLTTN